MTAEQKVELNTLCNLCGYESRDRHALDSVILLAAWIEKAARQLEETKQYLNGIVVKLKLHVKSLDVSSMTNGKLGTCDQLPSPLDRKLIV